MEENFSDTEWPPSPPSEEGLAAANKGIFEAARTKLQTILTNEKGRSLLEEVTDDDLSVSVVIQHCMDTLRAPLYLMTLGISKLRNYRNVGAHRIMNNFSFDPECAENILCGMDDEMRKDLGAQLYHEVWNRLLRVRREIEKDPDDEFAPGEEQFYDPELDKKKGQLLSAYKALLAGKPRIIKRNDD